MKVRLKDGTSFKCGAPTEQRVNNSTTKDWVLNMEIYNVGASETFNETFTEENISTLDFIDDTDEVAKYSINGYTEVNSVVIRHDESACNVQLIKRTQVKTEV